MPCDLFDAEQSLKYDQAKLQNNQLNAIWLFSFSPAI